MKKRFLARTFFLVLIFLSISQISLFAQNDKQWIRPLASGEGNWSDPANWNPVGVPQFDDNVIFDETGAAFKGNCLIDVDAVCNDFTVINGILINVISEAGNARRLEVYGDLSAGNRFVANDGTIAFVGSENVSVVSVDFNIAEINKDALIDIVQFGNGIGDNTVLHFLSGTLELNIDTKVVAEAYVVSGQTRLNGQVGNKVLQITNTLSIGDGTLTIVDGAEIFIAGNLEQTGSGTIIGRDAVNLANPFLAGMHFTGAVNSNITGNVNIQSGVLIDKDPGVSVSYSTSDGNNFTIGTSVTSRNLVVLDGVLRLGGSDGIIVNGNVTIGRSGGVDDGYILGVGADANISLSGEWNSENSDVAGNGPIQGTTITTFFGDSDSHICTSPTTVFKNVNIGQVDGGKSVIMAGTNPFVSSGNVSVFANYVFEADNLVNGNWGAAPNTPSGAAIVIPAADVQIAGNIVIQENGGFNLYKNEPVDANTITLFLGGNIIDNNSEYADNTLGFFVTQSNVTGANSDNNNLVLPTVVFIGSNAQILRGNTRLKTYLGARFSFRGIYLPNVYVAKSNNTDEVSIFDGLRVHGEMNIVNGTFDVNGGSLVFGNRVDESINNYGILYLPAGSNLYMCTGGTNRGTFLRTMDGGETKFIGTSADRVVFQKDGTASQYNRMEVAAGGNIQAIYADFKHLSSSNLAYSWVGYNDENIDNLSKGGIKIFSGAFVNGDNGVNFATANSGGVPHNFSYCTFSESSFFTSFLTINTGQELTIEHPVFTSGSLDFGRNIIANPLDVDGMDRDNDGDIDAVQVADAGRAGLITVTFSNGNIGGLTGEAFDGGTNDNNTSTAIDRIIWQNLPPIYWVGNYNVGGFRGAGEAHVGSSTAWNNYLNWSLSNTSYENPGQIFPGQTNVGTAAVIANYTDPITGSVPADTLQKFDVMLCKTAPTHPNLNQTIRIKGSVIVNSGLSHGLTADDASTIEERLLTDMDIVPQDLDQPNKVLSIANNIDLIIEGSLTIENRAAGNADFPLLRATGNSDISIYQNIAVNTDNPSFDFGDDFDLAQIILLGSGEQEIIFGDDDNIEVLRITKGSGSVILQGNSFGGSTLDCYNLNMLRGRLKILSTGNLRVRNNVDMFGELILDGDLTVGGNFTSICNVTSNIGTLFFSPSSAANKVISTGGELFGDIVFEKDLYDEDPPVVAGDVLYEVMNSLNASGEIRLKDEIDLMANDDGVAVIKAQDLIVQSDASFSLNDGDNLYIYTNDPTPLNPTSGDETGSLLIMDGGSLSTIGSGISQALISRDGNSYYSFTVEGDLEAQYFSYQFMDENGVNLSSATTTTTDPDVGVGTLSNGVISNGLNVDGATLIKLPENNIFGSDIMELSFPIELTAANTSNVDRSIGSDATPTVIIDANGLFSGEDFDNDGVLAPNGYVDWQYSRVVKRWDGGGNGVNWNDDNNWTDNIAPKADEIVILDNDFVPGDYDVFIANDAVCYDLTIDATVSKISLNAVNGADLSIGNNFNAVGEATFTLEDAANVVNVAQDWINKGSFVYDSDADDDNGGVIFDNAVKSPRVVEQTDAFWDLAFNDVTNELSSDLTVDNDLTVSFGTTLSASQNNYDIIIGGDMDIDGRFEPFLNTVTFAGDADQSLDMASNSFDFYNIVINKDANSSVTLLSAIRVLNNLTLNEGMFSTDGLHDIILGADANWTRNAAATSAFVDGPFSITYTIEAEFEYASYPVGIEGEDYRGGNSKNEDGYTIGVSLKGGVNTGTFTMWATSGDPEDWSADPERTLPDGIDLISRNRYFNVRNRQYPVIDNPDFDSPDFVADASGMVIKLPINQLDQSFDDGDDANGIGVNVNGVDYNAFDISLVGNVHILQDYEDDDDEIVQNGFLSRADIGFIAGEKENIIRRGLSDFKGDRWRDLGGVPFFPEGGSGVIQTEINPTDLVTLGNGQVVFGFYFVPLPVELIDLEASIQQGNVLLNWIANTQGLNAKFIIERSRDAKEYEAVGEVAGLLNTRLGSYQFVDHKPSRGVNYYRLRVIEEGQADVYSKIVAVNIDRVSTQNRLLVYPNPTQKNDFTLAFSNAEFSENVKVDLYQSNGSKINNFDYKLKGSELSIKTEYKLPEGVYLIKVIDQQKAYTTRLLVL